MTFICLSYSTGADIKGVEGSECKNDNECLGTNFCMKQKCNSLLVEGEFGCESHDNKCYGDLHCSHGYCLKPDSKCLYSGKQGDCCSKNSDCIGSVWCYEHKCVPLYRYGQKGCRGDEWCEGNLTCKDSYCL